MNWNPTARASGAAITPLKMITSIYVPKLESYSFAEVELQVIKRVVRYLIKAFQSDNLSGINVLEEMTLSSICI